MTFFAVLFKINKKVGAAVSAAIPKGGKTVSDLEQRNGQGNALSVSNNTNLPAPSVGNALGRNVPPVSFPALQRERRSFFGRLLVLLLLGAILFGAVMIFRYRPSSYAERTNSVRFLYRAENGQTSVVVNGSLLDVSLQGECVATAYSATGSVVGALIDDTLYLIDGREVREIGRYILDFVLSQNGKTVVYRTVDGELYYVSVGKELDASVISTTSTDTDYCLSPDGKELFYTYVRDEALYVDIFSRTNSKPLLRSSKDITPLAIGNGCKFLYYRDAAGDLFSLEKGSDIPTKLCTAELEATGLTFNRDFSELLVQTNLGTRLWRDGERVVLPDLKAGESLELLPNKRVSVREVCSGTQVLQKTFLKNYYLKRGSAEGGLLLMYLAGKGELEVVSFVDENPGGYVVTDHGVYFLVVENRADGETMKHLYHCPAGKSEIERLSWNVSEFCVNSDGSVLLYTDQHGALYSMREGRIPTRIADTVTAGSMQVTADDVFYYYIGDALYTSDDGATPRVVFETDAPMTFVDGYTAYFLQLEGDLSLTVYANHRNRRSYTEVARNIAYFD